MEGGQGKGRAQALAGLVANPEDLQLPGEVGERLARHHHVPVGLGSQELPRHGDVRHQEVEGPFAAPAEGVDAGVHHQPGGAHQRRAERAEQAALVGVQAGFLCELLGIQAPALGEHRDAPLALEVGQAGEQLHAGQLQVMPGHRFVKGNHLGVPSGAGRGPPGIEPERPWPAAVEARRRVMRRRTAHGHNLRHGRHLARRWQRLGEELHRPLLGPLHRGHRPADGFLRGHLPGGIAQRGEHLVQPGKPQARPHLHGPGLQRRDVVQAGPM